MRRGLQGLLCLIVGAMLINGCVAAWVGVAAVGAGSGTYYYINGEMKTDYYYPFDTTWSACQKSVADMRGVDVEQNKEIGSGKISALINDEKVKIELLYKAKNVTTVSIRVSLMGDKLASQLLHDKISDHLGKK